jgi:hypothetical protein
MLNNIEYQKLNFKLIKLNFKRNTKVNQLLTLLIY